jgi:hypothetical protein
MHRNGVLIINLREVVGLLIVLPQDLFSKEQRRNSIYKGLWKRVETEGIINKGTDANHVTLIPIINHLLTNIINIPRYYVTALRVISRPTIAFKAYKNNL